MDDKISCSETSKTNTEDKPHGDRSVSVTDEKRQTEVDESTKKTVASHNNSSLSR